MTGKLIIYGGNPLKGEVSLGGAKNSGFKLMIASLLSTLPSRIDNFSKIGDVISTAMTIEELGGQVTFGENHTLVIKSDNLNKFTISESTGKLSRASTYFVGPLINRFGKAIIPVPGGCKIGRRPLDRHLAGFKALGMKIEDYGDYYSLSAKRLKGTVFRFPKNTHGGTDVMLIASVLAEGRTILENAALEPEVDDLINFLNRMGAKIIRMSGRKIIIDGVEKLEGTNYEVMPDSNEAITFACMSLCTKGDIFVKGANHRVLDTFLKALKETNGGFEVSKEGIRFFYKKHLKAKSIITKPYPGFMTDWQALWTVLMTQTEGVSIIHETVFENRFGYVSDLLKMGAKIELFNPEIKDPKNFYVFNWEDNKPEYFHAVRVTGKTPLKGASLAITDIRAGATLILAALAAEGKSELLGLEHIDRGYENLDGRLRDLGGEIVRVVDENKAEDNYLVRVQEGI